MNNDQTYMNRALELAQLGIGEVSPNPMVGCVIVYNDAIIGEGWHKTYGGPHAEVNAINSVKDKAMLSESTIYITLEPCSHFGKTPPCADLLVEHKLKRVVLCNLDPNPVVKNNGVEKLKAVGIEVDIGILSERGKETNKRFFSLHVEKRPYIILKWAQTKDGFAARKNYDSKWISNNYSRRLVHTWRGQEDAILVGTNTAKYDNPKLNVRQASGRNPIRIVVDKNLSLNNTLHLFDQSQPTICYNMLKDETKSNLQYIKLDNCSVDEIIADLYQQKVQSLIVEGGAQTLNSFIKQNLWDEARVFSSDQEFNNGITAPKIEGSESKTEDISGDSLEIIKR